jgi:hypothetical protein
MNMNKRIGMDRMKIPASMGKALRRIRTKSSGGNTSSSPSWWSDEPLLEDVEELNYK